MTEGAQQDAKPTSRRELALRAAFAVGGLVLGAAGKAASDMATDRLVERPKARHQIVVENSRALVDSAGAAVDAVRRAYIAVVLRLDSNYALTPRQFGPVVAAADSAITRYRQFTDAVARRGTPDQLNPASLMLQVLERDQAELHLQANLGRDLLSRFQQLKEQKLRTGKGADSSQWASLSGDIDRFAANENRLYFGLKFYSLPLIDQRRRYIYGHFRQEIGLGALDDGAEAPDSNATEFARAAQTYSPTPTPLADAQVRSFLAPQFRAPPDQFLRRKEKILELATAGKFIQELDGSAGRK